MKYLKVVEAYNRIGLTTDTNAEIYREHGRGNVKAIRPATSEDVSHIRSMGGHVPEGKIKATHPQRGEK